jgi:predicted dehydrogenase
MSTSSAPVRVLVAGAGAFGREHLARLAARSDVSLVGVADVNPAALEPTKSRYGALKCLTDPLRLIDDVEADAIVIATPAGSHAELCLRALGRSLCVLLEKPIAPSAAAAAPLVSSAPHSSSFVLPGHVLRFSADHERLIAIVRSGRIGEVVYVNSRRYRDDAHAVRYPDTDPILMTLIHDVDLALWVTNSDFRSVLARRSGAGYRSMTAVSATTTNGVACDLRTAWTFEDGELPPDCLEVVGARGSVELVVGQTLRVYAEGGCADYHAVEADDPLRNEQDHFLQCVRDRSRAPAVDLPQALAGLKLADAAMESLRLNREVFLSA